MGSLNRRTPLQRRTPLRARTPLVATSPPKTRAAKRKPPRYTGPTPRVRALVAKRERYACVCCGRPVTGQRAALQHRDARGMGGTADPRANSPVNLILMLQECHDRVESRRYPQDNANGYWLRMGEDPALTPVVYSAWHGGFTAWLTADGGWITEAPAGAA